MVRIVNLLSLLTLMFSTAVIADSPQFGANLDLNYRTNDWDNNGYKKREGDFFLDHFAINADGAKNGINYSVKYAWFNDFHSLMYGFASMDLTDDVMGIIGMDIVPFGIMETDSHNWWGNIPYYMGLDYNYKPGIKFIYANDSGWDIRLGLFKNDFIWEESRTSKSYYYNLNTVDVADAPESLGNFDNTGLSVTKNINTGQANLIIAKDFNVNDNLSIQLGLSGEGSRIHNTVTQKNGSKYATAAHVDLQYNNFNFQLEAMRYKYSLKNKDNDSRKIINMGGYNTSFLAPAKANIFVFNIAYDLAVNCGKLQDIQIYNNYSVLRGGNTINTAKLNILGAWFNFEPIDVYLDLVTAKNMIFAPNSSSIGLNEDFRNEGGKGHNNWKTLVNLNLTYTM